MKLLPNFGPIGKGVVKLIILGIVVLYVVSPIDLLPEAFLGPIGFIDDIAVMLFGASFLGFDLLGRVKQKRVAFRIWKKN